MASTMNRRRRVTAADLRRSAGLRKAFATITPPRAKVIELLQGGGSRDLDAIRPLKRGVLTPATKFPQFEVDDGDEHLGVNDAAGEEGGAVAAGEEVGAMAAGEKGVAVAAGEEVGAMAADEEIGAVAAGEEAGAAAAGEDGGDVAADDDGDEA